jgi:hypothetical protein
MGEDRRAAYQCAKSGLYGLTRHTATLGGKHGVRCNSVAPGVKLTGAALANTTEDDRDEILASVRSQRLGLHEDLAAMVAFLFSDLILRRGAYVTGQTILVDGGATSPEPLPFCSPNLFSPKGFGRYTLSATRSKRRPDRPAVDGSTARPEGNGFQSRDGSRCVSPGSSCMSKTVSRAAVPAYIPAREMFWTASRRSEVRAQSAT